MQHSFTRAIRSRPRFHEQWQGLTDSFDSVRASLDRLEDNLGRAAGGLRATRDVLAGGAIGVGAVVILPVGVALAAGGAAVVGGLALSGAKRWNEGQSELEVVFGAAADTTGVTSFSRGLWGTDPVTGLEVALTPEAGTYELIVGASSISMLVGMPFANGLRGPTTNIPVPIPQLRFVESVSIVGETLVASPVRVPTLTWTEGAIEVSHQGVAIASAYAGTTRIVAMMASGPMPNGVPTPSPRSQELIDILAPGGQPIGVRLGGARDSIRTLPGGEPAAEAMFQRLIAGRNPVDITPLTYQGRLVRLDDGSIIGFRPTSTSGPPAININIPGFRLVTKLHYQ